jgi:hypothetical protein
MESVGVRLRIGTRHTVGEEQCLEPLHGTEAEAGRHGVVPLSGDALDVYGVGEVMDEDAWAIAGPGRPRHRRFYLGARETPPKVKLESVNKLEKVLLG